MLILRIIAILILVLLTNGCSFNFTQGNIEHEKNLAIMEVQMFHEGLNNEQYEVIYEKVSPLLQQAQNETDMVAALKNVRKEFGKF